MRPCEQTITLTNGKVYTPDNINYIASHISLICDEINAMDNIDDIHKFTQAIRDNWRRFAESC